MTVEADLFTALTALTSGRVYPDVGPELGAKPYLTYQQVGGAPANFLAGIPNKRNARFQINSWATTRTEAMALIRQVEDIVRLSTVLNATTEGGAVAVYDEETHLYGARQDFSIWFAA
jgi:hypothetical protein